MSSQPETTTRWLLCDLCHGVAHDPDPNGRGEPCDNCAGRGMMPVTSPCRFCAGKGCPQCDWFGTDQ